MAAKHKSTIRIVLNNIYPDLKVYKNDIMIQFIKKEELLKIKRNIGNKFVNSNSYYMNINWNDDNLNFHDIFKKKEFTPFSSISNTFGQKYLYSSDLRRNKFNYKLNKDKYYYSTWKGNNDISNGDNINNIDIFNLKDLINIYPIFLRSLHLNEGQFWKGNIKEELTDEEFKQWFSGFVDAEGLFFIKLRANKLLSCFIFEIHLHIDDLATLNYIKVRLGMV